MTQSSTPPSFQDPLGTALNWLITGRKVALATVLETWGSAPRPVGSHLVIDGDGNFEGSVSGGCVEGAVVAEAVEALEDCKPRRLSFGVEDETAWQVGLSCGGKISVFIEPLGTGQHRDMLAAHQAAKNARQPSGFIIDTTSGQRALYDAAKHGAALEAFNSACKSGRSGYAFPGSFEFLEIHVPEPRLVIIGAVHIAQALVPMAQAVGLDVSVVDPRSAFASPARFGDCQLLAAWPEDVLDTLKLDEYTALACLSHDPKIDDLPLIAALKAGCFYVGALGSRRTHAKRQDRLQAKGIDAKNIAGIKAPIGLDIGAATPPEIAVAVIAEVIASLRQQPLQEA
ncbi:XdhC family protein [Polycladidibacter hongkongensis]|uniref:XdhC family protein n=1 Tax=Polycladidibacter hongkongensis TaxID=1647556 RepID=UPI00082A8C2F|nr:XdhC family protein [Pseudovibrio hongkongensis]